MMLAALLALTVESLLLSGGMGFSRVLRAARRPGSIGVFSLFVTLFSLMSAGSGLWLNRVLAGNGALRTAALAAAAAVSYLLVAGLLRGLLPGFFKRNEQTVALAAVNTVVLAMPYVQELFGFGPVQAAGYALGTGAAFFLASLVLAGARGICSNPDMPEAFSGLPATLIYVGILSMAFAGFTGGRVF